MREIACGRWVGRALTGTLGRCGWRFVVLAARLIAVKGFGMGRGIRAVMLATAVALGAAGAGCGVLKRRSAKPEEGYVDDMRHGRRPMGQVTVVNTEKRFVLVQSPLAGSASPESVLVVKSQGSATTTGKVKVTPERTRNRVAADIVEGEPKVGDVVFFETSEKVLSTAPPSAGEWAAGVPGAPVMPGAPGGTAPVPSVPGTSGVSLPSVVPPPEPREGAELPPLGEPSGPREFIPNFPGVEPLPEPSDPSLPSGDSGTPDWHS